MARAASDIGPRIVAAARARFLREGVDGASLRAIARDAGTSIGMIYYYHPTKDDLFLAVVEEVYVALLKDLEARLAPARPVPARLSALYDRIAAASDDEQQVLRLVVREALTSPARLARLFRRFQRGHVPLLVELVRDGVATGLFRADLAPPFLLAAIVAIGGPGQAILEVIDRHLAPRTIPARDARSAGLLSVLLTGIAQPAKGSARTKASTSSREAVPPPRTSR
ncbi:MAG TPA: TetR/AcrR family transcriptional regulator [Polyangia bacterium]|nr:TetR/AcrR family transcriptional regulator [Polyangia bacterium]